MVNIAPAPSIANHSTTHMLSTMLFSLVPGPAPYTDITHVLDMVPSHNRVGYRSQDTHILHHLHL